MAKKTRPKPGAPSNHPSQKRINKGMSAPYTGGEVSCPECGSPYNPDVSEAFGGQGLGVCDECYEQALLYDD